MAKVSILKYNINGKDYVTNVNVGTDGLFKCNLPIEVSEALNIKNKLSFDTLIELEKDFNSTITRYKNANTTEELFILIQYSACGKFAQDENGLPLFKGNSYGNKYKMESFGSHHDNGLSLDFEVLIKQTIDSIESWYSTRKGIPHFNESGKEYRKDLHMYQLPKNGKLIPFTEQSLSSLEQAHKKLRKLSELLYNFIEQDELLIEQTLTNNRLLK